MFRLYIPYVNGLDLLTQCLRSVSDIVDKTTIINNSGIDVDLDHLLFDKIEIFSPPVPLGFAQTMNLIQKLAVERELAFYLFAHSDCKIENYVHQKIINLAQELKGSNWGAIFTLYDVFAAFNPEALKKVGEWDYKAFPWYYSDNDYYRRLKLSGFEIIPSPYGGVVHQNEGSNTLKNSPTLNIAERCYNVAACEVYIKKWGGVPGEEKFQIPPF
jgi:hypothetical protein